jgi:hypothetical protein
VWPEAGVVVFVDRLGGIWYTDGDKCDRLDRFGPKPPSTATSNDHVAAMGKHLFVWRNSRLLLFSLVASSGDEASGCWTELVAPAEGVTGLVGSGEEMFFVSNGVAWRYTMNGPDAERGKLHNVATDITVSTATLGDEDEHKRKNWHRYGMTFEALSNAEVRTIRVQASGALNYTTAPATYTSTLNRAYSNGYSSFVVPAGIGAQVIASATVTFRGYVRLQEASFWTTGEEPKR